MQKIGLNSRMCEFYYSRCVFFLPSLLGSFALSSSSLFPSFSLSLSFSASSEVKCFARPGHRGQAIHAEAELFDSLCRRGSCSQPHTYSSTQHMIHYKNARYLRAINCKSSDFIIDILVTTYDASFSWCTDS